MSYWLNDIKWANPYFFWLLLLIPLMVWHYWLKWKKQSAALRMPTLSPAANIKPSIRLRFLHLPFILRILAIVLLIACMARPQSKTKGRDVNTEGIDIVLSLDISGSMLAEDFKPNRIEAAKKIAAEFIDSRPNDRIGLVIFAGESFTQCPITTDHSILKSLLAAVSPGMFQDGTAIGEGLGTAVARIKASKAKSKLIILLTDGVNNAGVIAPLTAAEIAKTFGIRVYTVGIGTTGYAPYPMQTPLGTQYQNMEVQIDEPVLKQIANNTGGRYYRATGNNKLREIYKEIDKLEKTKINVTEYSQLYEEFLPIALLAALLLFTELILRYTWLKIIP